MRYDPQDPELRAWLARLAPAEQYVARCALLRIFRCFQKDGCFKSDTEALRVRIKPERNVAELLKAAREQSEQIERTLRRRAVGVGERRR